MCQRFREYQSFQSVTGTITLIGNMPMASELTTTAGRVFVISAPLVGSKLTSQMSPRLIVNDVPRLQVFPGHILFVMGRHLFGLPGHDPSPLGQR